MAKSYRGLDRHQRDDQETRGQRHHSYRSRGVSGACPCGHKLPRVGSSWLGEDRETLYHIYNERCELMLGVRGLLFRLVHWMISWLDLDRHQREDHETLYHIYKEGFELMLEVRACSWMIVSLGLDRHQREDHETLHSTTSIKRGLSWWLGVEACSCGQKLPRVPGLFEWLFH